MSIFINEDERKAHIISASEQMGGKKIKMVDRPTYRAKRSCKTCSGVGIVTYHPVGGKSTRARCSCVKEKIIKVAEYE